MPLDTFREKLVVRVECFAGKDGTQDAVKLEEKVWITSEGPVVIPLYPYETILLE